MHLRLNPTLAEYLAHVNSLKMQDLLFSIGFNFTCRIYFYTQPMTQPLSTGTAYVLNVIYARREQLKALSHMKLD